MVSLLCHLHFWTLKALSPGNAMGADIGSHVYHEKSRAGRLDAQGTEDSCRKDWAEGRGITWTPRNKKPDKLRDNLREYEELMSLHRPVCIKWKTHRHCLVLLENGILVTFALSKHSGDIERVFIDRTLITRLHANLDNALIVGNNIVLTVTDDPRPACLSLSHRRSSAAQVPLTLKKTDSGRRLEKLSSQDPKMSYAVMGEMPVGEVDRHIMASCEGDLFAVWWRDSSEHGRLWSPGADKGYNLILFTMENGKLDFVYGMEMTYDPVDIQFSKLHNTLLLSVEKNTESTYLCRSYDCRRDKLSRTSSETTVSSEATITMCERNGEETKILLGCEDRTLILHDCTIAQRPALKTKVVFFSSISLIRWHPDDSLVFVCGSRGQVQCYDLALNPLTFQILSETPSQTPLLQIGECFVAQVHLKLAEWGSAIEEGDCNNFLMVFDRGPVVVLRMDVGILSRGHLGPAEMITEYITENQADKAISVLIQQNWSPNPSQCFICLTLIMDHLLTQPLSTKTEEQIALTLSFFESKSITSDAYYTYKNHIGHLKRRFFHLLIRYKRLEKAMEVAKTVETSMAKDLFMDVHFLAVDQRDPELAESAKQRAEQLSNSDFFSDVLQSIAIAQSKQNDD